MDQSALLDLLAQLKLTDVTDRIRVATETLYEELIDAEATVFIGAGPFERTDDRTTHRNGTRQRTLTTTAGELDLRIPKLPRVLVGSATPRRLWLFTPNDLRGCASLTAHYRHLTLEDRIELEKLLDQDVSRAEIARRADSLREELGKEGINLK